MIYIGIDPGGSGGIAWLSDSDVYRGAVKMPETERDVLDLLEKFRGDRAIAMLERVWAGPRMGSSASFKFGVGVGGLRMALVSARIPFDEPTPQKWQTLLGCRAHGKGFGARDDTAAKNITKRRAQALFPDLTVTHAIADALLIAEYCRRIHRSSSVGGEVTNGKEESNRAQQTSEARQARKPFDGFVPKGRTRTFRAGGPGGGKRAAAQAGRAVGPAPGNGAGPQRPAR